MYGNTSYVGSTYARCEESLFLVWPCQLVPAYIALIAHLLHPRLGDAHIRWYVALYTTYGTSIFVDALAPSAMPCDGKHKRGGYWHSQLVCEGSPEGRGPQTVVTGRICRVNESSNAFHKIIR